MAPTMQLYERDTSCPGGQCGNSPSSEKYYIAGGVGASGAIVLAVGGILLYKRLKDRSRSKSLKEAQRLDQMSTPIMSHYAPSTFSFKTQQPQNTYQPPTRPIPSSPVSSYHDSSSSGSSSSGHSQKSPMSDGSHSQFAFPMLSADGHLMPALPASARQSWNIAEGDLGSGAGNRPLPLAPGEHSPSLYEYYDYSQYGHQMDENPFENEAIEKSMDGHSIKAPIPYNPNQRWSYEPPSEQVIGLYPVSDLHYEEEQGQGYEYDGGSIRTNSRTPRIENTNMFGQPQSATYHRSFSAEGEYIRAD